MRYAIIQKGESRSFPAGDPFLVEASPDKEVEILICLGAKPLESPAYVAVLVELGVECLADHVGLEDMPDNVLGFARFCNGADAPSNLVELVSHDGVRKEALEAARAVFEAAGLTVAVCNDQAGRIIDRLVRPKYNAALQFLDEGLATQADMDLTCRLGLGYPDGPIERVVRGGLAHHFDVTTALFQIYGTQGYAPARRAVVAARRRTES